MAVLQEWLLSGYWGQINKYLPVMLFSLGKLEVEMPPEECAPGMSLTWSMLWLQSHRHDGNVFCSKAGLPGAVGEHLLDGAALHDTTLAWCKEWTCWSVRFGSALETCCPSS